MRIFIATGIYPPDIGGPATYVKLLEDKLPQKGIFVAVYSFGEVRRYPKVVRHLMYFLGVLKRGRGTDMIFAQDPVSVGFPAMLAAGMLRKKFILRLGGDYAWEQAVQRYHTHDNLDEFSKRENYPLFVRALKYIQKSVAQHAEKIVVPSMYLKGILENWGINKDKIVVIYNAFTSAEMVEDKLSLRKKFNMSGTIIFSAGRLVPWKGFAALITLMPELLRTIPDVKLFIAGDGPERKILESLAAECRLQDRVIFLGRLPQDQLLLYIKASDIFVLNTGYEGFSHQLLEVMAVGTPIVTTAIGGNKELVKDGEDGILIEYNNQKDIGEAIKKLLGDESMRQKLSGNARKKVLEFTQERMIQETIKQLS